MGGKGGNTTSTVTQQNIPKEFFPYFDRLLAQAENEMGKPYQAYEGERLAGTSADTGSAYDLIRDVSTRGAPGRDAATSVANRNIAQAEALMSGAGPYQFSQYGGFTAGKSSPYAGFSAVSPTEYTDFVAGSAQPFSDFREGSFKEFQFGPAGQFTGEAVGQYMDPYIQNVLNIQKEQALEDYDIARQGRSSRAVAAGAFGGSRAAVQEGLAERDLLRRQAELQAQGLSSAYKDAQGLFEADRAARMATEQAQAGEGARVQTGTVGEMSRVQAARAAELARTQGISIDEAARVQESEAAERARVQRMTQEEAARIQAAEAAEIARTQGLDIAEAARVQAGQAAELARVQGAQAAEDRAALQDKFTAMGFTAEQASLVADLEQQARTGDIQAAQLLETIGKAQEAKAQAGLDIDYEDYLRQQGYNQEQIGFMSNILQGLPIGKAGETVQQTPYNPVQQALGAGLAGLSLYQGFQ